MSAAAEALARAFAPAAEGEPAWLAERRLEGLRLFEAAGLPHTKLEDWRFTSLDALESLELEPAPEAAPVDSGLADAVREDVGPALCALFVDGREREIPAGEAEGISLEPLTRAAGNDALGLQGRLGALADPKRRSLTALNAALFPGGASLEIAADARPERPIHLVWLQSDGSHAAHPRCAIRAGAGSRACVIEHFVSGPGARGLCNPVTEIELEPGARLDHVVVQDQSGDVFQLGALAARGERDSELRTTSIALGGRLARWDVYGTLAGEGARLELNGLYLARARQLLDHHTTIDHAAPRTTSEESFKGILDGRGHGVFHGRIHVRPDAQQIEAAQTHRSLLLSDQARINAKPQLEIYADDVRCSHGATVGQLDADQLFYLRARGLTLARARALLTFGFAREICERIPHAALREALERRVLNWLPAGDDA